MTAKYRIRMALWLLVTAVFYTFSILFCRAGSGGGLKLAGFCFAAGSLLSGSQLFYIAAAFCMEKDRGPGLLFPLSALLSAVYVLMLFLLKTAGRRVFLTGRMRWDTAVSFYQLCGSEWRQNGRTYAVLWFLLFFSFVLSGLVREKLISFKRRADRWFGKNEIRPEIHFDKGSLLKSGIRMRGVSARITASGHLFVSGELISKYRGNGEIPGAFIVRCALKNDRGEVLFALSDPLEKTMGVNMKEPFFMCVYRISRFCPPPGITAAELYISPVMPE